MVEFDVVAGLAAGLAATVVVTAMATVATTAGMPPLPLVLGSMFSGDRHTANVLGTMLHYAMGTVVVGLGFAALFTTFDNDAWWVGALLGVGQGLVVGLVIMPLMPALHPRMTHESASFRAPAFAGPAGTAALGTDDHGEVEITSPGVFGKNWGSMLPAGLVVAHATYGIVLALVYSAIA